MPYGYGMGAPSGGYVPQQQKQPDMNWLLDPNAPWNQILKYGEEQLAARKAGLKEDVALATKTAGRQAVGQGLYTGTHTGSLPGEALSRQVAGINRGYAGALGNLEAQYLAQRQQHGQMMLGATQQDLWRKAMMESQGGGFMDWLGDLLKTAVPVFGAFLGGGDGQGAGQ